MQSPPAADWTLSPASLPCSPAPLAEGGRGPRPRRRARTASLQLLLGCFLRSRSLETDWDKMAELRGRSKQSAHVTRMYRPSLSPPDANLPACEWEVNYFLPLSIIFRFWTSKWLIRRLPASTQALVTYLLWSFSSTLWLPWATTWL